MSFSISAVEVERTRPLPDTLEYMRGVIDLRGKIVPVVDLKKKMGMEFAGGCGSTVVILEVHGALVGVVVDTVVDVVGIADLEIQKAPHFTIRAASDAVRGVVHVNGRMVVIIDAEKILTEKEMMGLARSA
jgi:purine-binding chemotaxis protein CheW